MLPTIRFLSIALFVAFGVTNASSQDARRVCKKSALAASKPIPTLRYSCAGAKDEWDDKILKLPARVRALKLVMAQLEILNSDAWWQASTDDLSVCDFRKRPGTLSAEEQEKFDTNYVFKLFGNDHIRLVLLPDPCYQTEYSGSVGFLLYHTGTKTLAAKSLDGFFTRADNAVDIDFAKLGREEIIEISTGSGGLHPELTNYYFTIDPRTNRAVPKNLFEGDKGPTNQITSAMLMNDPADVGLPVGSEALKVIDAHSLAKSFSIYNEVFEGGEIDDNGRKLNRIVLKWNGKMFK
jgi:hypothetical protein